MVNLFMTYRLSSVLAVETSASVPYQLAV